MTDREVHSRNFVLEGVINTINHNLCLYGKLIHITSTEKINVASYCGGPDFESLTETDHCDCGFLSTYNKMFSQSITSNKGESGEIHVLRPMASLKYKQLVYTFRYLKIRNRYINILN
jgi:hypothetical protein